MAAARKTPELGGYDYEFTVQVRDNCECLVCQLPMKDPVQIVGCGHRLCFICMESLLRSPSPLCPADRKPLSRDRIFPDSAFQREILNLTVKCPHSRCSWTGELRAAEKHQSECLLKEVQCSNPGCTEKLPQQDMSVHVAFECSWRRINCEYCQESVLSHKKQKHFDVCQKFPVQCTNECGVREIPRDKLEVHIRDQCPEAAVTCEYENLGCKAMFPRSNTDSHSKSEVEGHLRLALHCLEATRLQVHDLVSLVKEQSQQIERLMSSDQEKTQQMERLMAEVKEQSLDVKRLMSKDQEHSQHVQWLMSKDQEHSQHVQWLMSKDQENSQYVQWLMSKDQKNLQHVQWLMSKDQENSQHVQWLMSKDQNNLQHVRWLMSKDEENSQHVQWLMSKDQENSQQMRATPKDKGKSKSNFLGRILRKDQEMKQPMIAKVREQSEQIEKLEIANDPFVWKVPHFHALLGKAKTGVKQVLLSESFSLWKNGYMLRIKMMLEKFSELGSVFRSLSIVNVPGEFDKSLSWPFVEKIHVAIIDQNPCKEESDNMSHVIDFGHKRDRATFKALTITGDCEFGTMFASANELYNRSYIVNDAVLITASTEEDKVQPS